jgi:hypothetical protein
VLDEAELDHYQSSVSKVRTRSILDIACQLDPAALTHLKFLSGTAQGYTDNAGADACDPVLAESRAQN